MFSRARHSFATTLGAVFIPSNVRQSREYRKSHTKSTSCTPFLGLSQMLFISVHLCPDKSRVLLPHRGQLQLRAGYFPWCLFSIFYINSPSTFRTAFDLHQVKTYVRKQASAQIVLPQLKTAVYIKNLKHRSVCVCVCVIFRFITR